MLSTSTMSSRRQATCESAPPTTRRLALSILECSYLVTEYCAEGELFEYLQKHSLSEYETHKLFSQLISAVRWGVRLSCWCTEVDISHVDSSSTLLASASRTATSSSKICSSTGIALLSSASSSATWASRASNPRIAYWNRAVAARTTLLQKSSRCIVP